MLLATTPQTTQVDRYIGWWEDRLATRIVYHNHPSPMRRKRADTESRVASSKKSDLALMMRRDAPGVWLGEQIRHEGVHASSCQDLNRDCLPDLHRHGELRSATAATAKDTPRESLRFTHLAILHPAAADLFSNLKAPSPVPNRFCRRKRGRTSFAARVRRPEEEVSRDRCSGMASSRPALESACTSRLRDASRTTHRRGARKARDRRVAQDLGTWP